MACFCIFKNFDFFPFVLLHSFYVSCELLYFCINWSLEVATGRFSAKKLYYIFTQKLLEEVQVLVVLYVVSLQIYSVELLHIYFSIILSTQLPS